MLFSLSLIIVSHDPVSSLIFQAVQREDARKGTMQKRKTSVAERFKENLRDGIKLHLISMSRVRRHGQDFNSETSFNRLAELRYNVFSLGIS